MRSLPSALLSMLSICAVCRSAAQPASIPSAQDVRHESAAAALTANEPFTPTAVIERVGRDPAAIAEFVAQRIAVDPYEGALRSPRAVLITRSANSLDRARLLAALLEAAGHRARVIARARAAPTSPASGAERSLAPPILEDVATAAFRELLALGDALHAQGLLGDTTSAAVETRTGARVEFGAQVLDPALGWRDIGGPATVPASAAEAVPDGGSSPLQLTVEVLYGADGELAQRTVLQAELPLEQIEFAPIVLEFAIGDGSATPRLHVAGTVLSGDRFPVAATQS